MADTIKTSLDGFDLQKQINGVLAAYGLRVDDLVQEAIDTDANEAVKKLKSVSLSHNWRSYASGWRYQKQKQNRDNVAKIYNGKHGSLTHLLENGHEIISHGQATGKRTRAFPHIAAVDAWLAEQLPKDVEKAIQNDK